jgi:hypothetical protein
MRLILRLLLCCALATGVGMAQRGGGARGGGGGGGSRGGGGFGGGGFRGGGFVGGGFRGGVGGFGGFRGYGYGFGYRGFYGPYWGLGWGWPYWGWPYWGLGYGDYYPYGDPGYYPYGGGYPYAGGYGGYPAGPNVTVVYPPPTQGYYAPPNTGYAALREYDEYGQAVRSATAVPNSSPIYLIAFNDHVIRAAAAYWVDGRTLHYVTLEHEQKQVPLDTVDRDMSLQLNVERRVPFQLPAQ